MIPVHSTNVNTTTLHVFIYYIIGTCMIKTSVIVIKRARE